MAGRLDVYFVGNFFGSGKEERSWCYSGKNSLAMVGGRGKRLQLYVGYSLEGIYLRGSGRRLSASRLGLGEFQLRLSFVEEAWLCCSIYAQTTCRGRVDSMSQPTASHGIDRFRG